MSVLRGVIVLARLSLNLAFWATLVLLIGIFKLVLPHGAPRRRLVARLTALADRWVAGNNAIFDAHLPIEWDIEGVEGLRRDDHYLIFANHITWADIFVTFRALHMRVAFIRFFLKQELAWMPFVGQAAWALEFPFVRRYSADDLASHPEKRGTDLQTTRRACKRYRTFPVAILNFLEGTRFTLEKHTEQDSPYALLLRPRIGGAAFVMASLGDVLDGVLDVTVAYPGHVTTFWKFISGRVRTVRVRVRQLDIPPEFRSDAITEPGPERDRFKAWIETIWGEKDEMLARLI